MVVLLRNMKNCCCWLSSTERTNEDKYIHIGGKMEWDDVFERVGWFIWYFSSMMNSDLQVQSQKKPLSIDLSMNQSTSTKVQVVKSVEKL